jgi:hypothetical protein
MTRDTELTIRDRVEKALDGYPISEEIVVIINKEKGIRVQTSYDLYHKIINK